MPDTTRRSDAAKYSFGSNQYARSGSVSDAELIFGAGEDTFASSVSTFKKYSRDNTSIDTSDSVFSSNNTIKRDTYMSNRSMSVSSAKDGDYIYQPTGGATANNATASYRVYEGIQNAAFSDYASPASLSSTTSSATGTHAAPITKKSSIFDDEYDLR